MTEPSDSEKIKELSGKLDSLILGFKIGMVLLIFLASFCNLGATLSITKFDQIFKDALGPDHPLPYLTRFLLGYQPLVTCLVFLWPALGLLAVFRLRKLRTMIVILTCLLILIVTQFVLTWTGMFMPMIALITGMSNTPSNGL